jgi:hypothetical protein
MLNTKFKWHYINTYISSGEFGPWQVAWLLVLSHLPPTLSAGTEILRLNSWGAARRDGFFFLKWQNNQFNVTCRIQLTSVIPASVITDLFSIPRLFPYALSFNYLSYTGLLYVRSSATSDFSDIPQQLIFLGYTIFGHVKWVPVTTAWRVLGLRMEERPPGMEGSCEYIE